MDEALQEIKIVVYKKVVEGDLKKFFAQSNITQSGGGARDLRFSPAGMFFPVFQRMFRTRKADGTYSGYFFWADNVPTEVTIHPPTTSRPNEVRIAKVHECIPDKHIPKSIRDCILIMILDSQNKVWPYFITEKSLREDDWHPRIKEGILEGLGARRSAKCSPMGYIDIENGGSFTNGR